MANKIVFDYEQIASAVAKIRNIADSYKTAAETLQNNVTAAIGTWEGESFDNFNALFTGDIKIFTVKNIPEMVTGLADLLEGNAKSMQETDAEIAKNIPTSIF